jgi:hypothetical protein
MKNKHGFTRQQQTLIDMIERVADASRDFEFYTPDIDWETRRKLDEELSDAKRSLYKWVNKKLCKKTLKK